MKLEPRQIKAGIDKWRKILHIESRWKIDYVIRVNSSDMSEGNEDSMACIDVDLRYFMAMIEFNSSEIKEKELDDVIVHELLHIILAPLSSSSGCGLGKKFEEINSIFVESTIERLMSGYLFLYRKKPSKKIEIKKSKTNRNKSRK